MIQVNERRLIAELVYTSHLINGTTNKYFFGANYSGFMQLNELLAYNFGKLVSFDEIDRKHRMYESMLRSSDKSICDFMNYIFDNKDLLLNISRITSKFLKKIKFNEIKFYDVVKVFNEKYFKEVILSFYSSLSNDYYKIAKKYFDEERINMASLYDETGASGLFSFLQWLGSGYIFSAYFQYNTASASTIVHELGHAIDFERFIMPQQKNIPVFSDCLCEFPSMTMEIAFQDYLKEEHIDIDGSRILKNAYIGLLKNYSKEIKHMLSIINKEELASEIMKDIQNDYMEYHCIDDEEKNKSKEENTTEEKEVTVEIIEQKEGIRDSILYGLGTLFGYNLNEIRKTSNKDFLKIYNNIMTLRKEYNLSEVIALTGIKEEDFITGKYIKPVIKADYLELKKRYNL